MDREDILTAINVCDILRVQSRTLHSKKWRAKVGLQMFRQGKLLFILKDDFWEWYKKRAGIVK